jgi:hypothetical protein
VIAGTLPQEKKKIRALLFKIHTYFAGAVHFSFSFLLSTRFQGPNKPEKSQSVIVAILPQTFLLKAMLRHLVI